MTSNDLANLEIALSAKSLVLKLPVIEAVLSPTELAAPSFAAAALGGRILGNGITGNILWIALATMITPNHPFCDKKVKFAAMEADFVPLYVETNCTITVHGWDLLELLLSPGDILYLTMPAHKLELLFSNQLTVNSYQL